MCVCHQEPKRVSCILCIFCIYIYICKRNEYLGKDRRRAGACGVCACAWACASVCVYRLCVVGGAFIPFARVGAAVRGLGFRGSSGGGGRGKGGGGSVIYY